MNKRVDTVRIIPTRPGRCIPTYAVKARVYEKGVETFRVYFVVRQSGSRKVRFPS